jgi:hypothetical protein
MTPLVTLPNTKIGLRVPLVTYYMAVSGYNAAAHGVVPDYPVNHTIDDLIAGHDKDMELALQLARKATRRAFQNLYLTSLGNCDLLNARLRAFFYWPIPQPTPATPRSHHDYLQEE